MDLFAKILFFFFFVHKKTSSYISLALTGRSSRECQTLELQFVDSIHLKYLRIADELKVKVN